MRGSSCPRRSRLMLSASKTETWFVSPRGWSGVSNGNTAAVRLRVMPPARLALSPSEVLAGSWKTQISLPVWFTVHYTPKHGSWLNQAEIAISLFSRQCLGRRRIADRTSLRKETQAWSRRMNRHRVPIQWKFTRKKARNTFGYHAVTVRPAEGLDPDKLQPAGE